jgi:hypothetical protein
MTLVCHMDEDWSRANLERERPDVAGELAPRFAAALGLASPGVVMAHRWRYARVAESAAPVAFDPDLALGVAGDWTVGPSVGDAFISAVRCAEAASRASATAS